MQKFKRDTQITQQTLTFQLENKNGKTADLLKFMNDKRLYQVTNRINDTVIAIKLVKKQNKCTILPAEKRWFVAIMWDNSHSCWRKKNYMFI